MKILHVIAGAPTGGAENIFLESVLALAEASFAQAVVTRANNAFRLEQLRAHGIEVATAPFDRWLRWRTRRVIEDMCRRFEPDVIQYWMGRAGTFARPGRPTQVAWYGGYYALKRFGHCDFHIGLTEDIVRHIVSQGVAPERTALIRTFADFAPMAPVARDMLNTPDDVPLLLALARLHWKKGLDVLLKAMPSLPRGHLWIAGEGPMRRELEALTRELGLSERVRFLGWRDDRAALLAAADICVFPSRYEPFGTVMVDAWAAGVPLIAAAAAGPKAYVDHGVNGLLVPIDDVQALAQAINRVLSEPGLSARLVANGRATYQAHFTKAVFLRDSAAFYARIGGPSP
jgi:glycosyltransferase involved in cell wall biosynthesis